LKWTISHGGDRLSHITNFLASKKGFVLDDRAERQIGEVLGGNDRFDTW
jgi:hypothetical protein